MKLKKILSVLLALVMVIGVPMTPSEKEAYAERIASESDVSKVQNGSKAYSKANKVEIDETTGKDKYLTDPVPEGKPLPNITAYTLKASQTFMSLIVVSFRGGCIRSMIGSPITGAPVISLKPVTGLNGYIPAI